MPLQKCCFFRIWANPDPDHRLMDELSCYCCRNGLWLLTLPVLWWARRAKLVTSNSPVTSSQQLEASLLPGCCLPHPFLLGPCLQVWNPFCPAPMQCTRRTSSRVPACQNLPENRRWSPIQMRRKINWEGRSRHILWISMKVWYAAFRNSSIGYCGVKLW